MIKDETARTPTVAVECGHVDLRRLGERKALQSVVPGQYGDLRLPLHGENELEGPHVVAKVENISGRQVLELTQLKSLEFSLDKEAASYTNANRI